MSIPASNIVTVNPSVLGAGGNAPVLTGVFLSQNTLIPTNQVLTFSSATEVGDYFGVGSTEYDLANRIYFQGYSTGLLTPGQLIIAPFNLAARSAFLQSGFLKSMTLTELQALSGEFDVTVDGVVRSTGALDFSAVTSFSQAATLIQTGLNSVVVCVSVIWNAFNGTFLITALSSGPSSTITYAVDDIASTLAVDLLLNSTGGGILSQGAALDTPQSSIDNLVAVTTEWFAITTLFEPIQADKVLFASAISSLGNKYCYVCWDTDADAIAPDSTTTAAYEIRQAQYNGTFMISGSSADVIAEGSTLAAATRDIAVFVLDFVASVDFNVVNGRTTAAFRSLAGLLPTVTSNSSSQNLLGNGYNFYGNYANSTNDWIFLYNGNVTGIYKWLDSLYGEVYLNGQIQTQLMELLTNLNSIPYNEEGYTSIKLALSGVITSAVNFGTIRAGVDLSQTQKTIVTAQAGLDISPTLFTQGWYLQVLDPGATARQNRQTPIINFWYTDGQSIQQIVLDSIDIL